RLAVPGHVECEKAKMPGDLLVGHQMAKLAAIGAGGVQANERDPPPSFLEVNAVRAAAELQREVAADDRLQGRGHQRASPCRRRGSASRSFRNCRLAISGWRSPSNDAWPRFMSALRSCQPGSGTGCQSRAHASAVPRTAKRQERMRNGPRSKNAILPAATVTSNGIAPMPTAKRASKKAPRRIKSGSAASSLGPPANAFARRSPT